MPRSLLRGCLLGSLLAQHLVSVGVATLRAAFAAVGAFDFADAALVEIYELP